MSKESNRNAKQPFYTTPLAIISLFVSFAEVAMIGGAIKTTGWIQGMLAVFGVIFPTCVAVAFFIILIKRPYVFYSPMEYGELDPAKFIAAIKEKATQAEADIEQIDEIKKNIIGMADNIETLQYDLLDKVQQLEKEIATAKEAADAALTQAQDAATLALFNN